MPELDPDLDRGVVHHPGLALPRAVRVWVVEDAYAEAGDRVGAHLIPAVQDVVDVALVRGRVDVLGSGLGGIEARQPAAPVERRPGQGDRDDADAPDGGDRGEVAPAVCARQKDERREHRRQLDPGIPAECEHDDRRADHDPGHPQRPRPPRPQHRHRDADGGDHELQGGVVAARRPAVEGDLAAARAYCDELVDAVDHHDRDEDLREPEAVPIVCRIVDQSPKAKSSADRQVCASRRTGSASLLDARPRRRS